MHCFRNLSRASIRDCRAGTAAGEDEITSVFTVNLARFRSSSRIVANLLFQIRNHIVARRTQINRKPRVSRLCIRHFRSASIPIFKFDEGLSGPSIVNASNGARASWSVAEYGGVRERVCPPGPIK
jgi:hypothetical protein